MSYVFYTLNPIYHEICSIAQSLKLRAVAAATNSQFKNELPDGRFRPRSYSHLLLRPTLEPFPARGLGVPGASPLNRLVAVLAPSWLEDPNDDFLPPPKPPATALWRRGLAVEGEYGDPLSLLSEAGLPLADSGELL
jgi:hypothetical protein